jgi:hypothetical protein
MRPSSVKNDLSEVVKRFPKLRAGDGAKFLEGEIDIFDADNNYVDCFNIKVQIQKNYPFGMPALFETAGKLDHLPDRHFNTDESCCVCSLQEADLVGQKGISINRFMDDYVVPFLANQIYFDSENEWANGEYAHGVPGIFQYYSELLKMAHLETVLTALKRIGKRKYNRNENCFCGNKRKLKHCHGKEYTTIRCLSYRRLNNDIQLLEDFLNAQIENKPNDVNL